MPFLLILFTLFFCWLFCGRYGVFGSKVDWISQHSVFPDYFRQQFYDTGDFFPEFAAGIGGGQNIYNFAYYGLYSPVFLLSYLLPFVKMSDYLIAASFTCLASAVVLLYFWLIKRGFSQTVSFLTARLFFSPTTRLCLSIICRFCVWLFGVWILSWKKENRFSIYPVYF